MRRLFRMAGVCVFSLASFVCGGSARGQTMTQSFVLQPGWNSVYLEVQPADNRADAVFGGLPIATVWTRAERLSSVEFIQNASEDLFNQPGWLAWLNPSRADAFLGNLYAVLPNHAYLIQMTNSAPMTWNVSGRPSFRHSEWVPDSFNLKGLPVDSAIQPTFQEFFRPSVAHYDTAAARLQPIYRLSPAGEWVLAAPDAVIRSGEAYWIFCKGASDYLAPMDVQLQRGDGIDFAEEIGEIGIRIRNRRTTSLNAVVRELNPTSPNALAYFQFDPTAGGQWLDLPAPLVQSADAGGEARLRLAIRRRNISGSKFTSLLQITDGLGSRLMVPVAAEKTVITAAALKKANVAAAATSGHAGLWSGVVTIDGVSETRAVDPTAPTPVKAPLGLRIIIHVDAGGQARLLKEVIQMWRNGSYTNDTSGNLVLDKPGEYVLLTDDRLISEFSGATLRDGTPAGRRLSAVGFDFSNGLTNNFVELAGVFAVANRLTADITLPHDAPTNPFLHRYNPDHDNLNRSFNGPQEESFTVRRQIELNFTASPINGSAAPDFGYSEMGGSYREQITGLHKKAIFLGGTFRLRRVSAISELNPSPTP